MATAGDSEHKAANMIHPNLQAYWKGHSTTTGLLELSDQLFKAAEDKQIAVALSVDQLSAFDSICHETLQEKLKLYGLTDKTR